MPRFRDKERQVAVAHVYHSEGLKVARHRSFGAASRLPDVEVWRNWTFRITIGGTRYVRYRERSYALAPGTIFWHSPVDEPVKTYTITGSGSDTLIVTFSLQRWRLHATHQSLFRERNGTLLASYPDQPILALHVAPPQLLFVLHRFLATAEQSQARPTVQENACHLLLGLIGDLQFNEHFQRVDHAQRGRVEAAQERIVASLAQPLNFEVIADELGISLRQLERDFRSLTGLTPVRYRNIVRLSEANTLLADTTLPIASIAARLGYANVAHFSAAFRQLYHCSPRDVRDSICCAEGRGYTADNGRDEEVTNNHATT
ncbi:MAG: hypothetical protein NVS2B7_37000 [Herpetosiphon sp.]